MIESEFFSYYFFHVMSNHTEKKRKPSETFEHVSEKMQLPVSCRLTVKTHVNSIYVDSIVRIYDKRYGTEGQLVTVHWGTDEGLFVTLHDEQRCDYVQLKYNTWVVDHRRVKPGAYVLHRRYGTDDIANDNRNKTVNEIKQTNSKILTNNMLMDFPTIKDRQMYECLYFC